MKRIMKTRWFWMVFGVLMWVGGYGQDCLEEDYIALRALYLSTDGDNWTFRDNWPNAAFFNANPTLPNGINIDNWDGIILNGGCVEILYLHMNQLSGTIPPELGNLSNLERLYLGSNELIGTIPPELGNLSNLEFLDLPHNQLIGTIPPELGNLSNLLDLNLGGNELSGTIPPELGNLSNLNDLFLGGNELSGTIPPELGNLSNLEFLDLPHNQLSGNIPPELGDLSNLNFLYLSHNQLSGNIPPELGNLSNLLDLFLNSNELIGTIPPELGSLSNLEWLYLSDNQLIGATPPELGNLSNLWWLNLSSNQLSGCYDNLFSLCGQLLDDYNTNEYVSNGNNFDSSWECFCANNNCNVPSLSIDLSANLFCGENSSIELTIESGVYPFEYNWSHGGNVQSPSGLSEGKYIVTVSDQEACNGVLIDSITITVPALPVINNIQIVDALCGNNGEIFIDNVSGGTPPYEYSIDNITFQSENSFSNIAAGTFEVSVKDAASCVDSESVTLGDDTPVVNLGADAFTCEPPNRILDAGYPDAQWSTGEIAQTISVTDYGTYSVTVTDADCEVTDEIILEDVIQFSASTVDTMIARGEDVGIGLSGADNYEWTPTNDLECVTLNCDSVRIEPEFSTEYTVRASTNDGCEKAFRIFVGIGGPSVFPPGGVLVFPELEDPDAFPTNQFSVYNRHGVQVFHAQPYDNTWDGTYNGQPLPTGNYYYLLELDVTTNNVIKQRLFIAR